MKKISNLLFIIFLFMTIFLGLEQLNHQSSIFADTRALCCEDYECNAEQCSVSASIKIYPGCEYDYSSKNCFDCIDLWAAGNLCRNYRQYFCWDGDLIYVGD